MSRFQNPVPEYTNNSGTLLANGLLYFYESGTNDTKKTYADVNETIENPHPLVLNGDGSVPNCFYTGAAKVILADENDVQLWERDPVTSTEVSSFGAQWDAVSIYDLNETVTFNNLLYVSIISNNQNNNPSTTPEAWTQFDLLKRWNVNETYQVRDPVIATDFTIYLSKISNNLGIDPTTDGGVNWTPSGAGSGATFAFADWDVTTSYGLGGANIVNASDGNYYVSLQASNLANDPISEPLFWLQIDHIEGGNITIEGDTIASTDTDSDIDITPNGTGKLTYNGVEVTNATQDAQNVKLSGAQSIADVKTFTSTIDGSINGNAATATSATTAATATNCSRSVVAGTGMTGGGALTSDVTVNVIGGSGITANANDVAVDSTVIRTTGNQSMSGNKNFTGEIQWDGAAFHARGTLNGALNVISGVYGISSIGKVGTGIVDVTLSSAVANTSRAQVLTGIESAPIPVPVTVQYRWQSTTVIRFYTFGDIGAGLVASDLGFGFHIMDS